MKRVVPLGTAGLALVAIGCGDSGGAPASGPVPSRPILTGTLPATRTPTPPPTTTAPTRTAPAPVPRPGGSRGSDRAFLRQVGEAALDLDEAISHGLDGPAAAGEVRAVAARIRAAAAAARRRRGGRSSEAVGMLLSTARRGADAIARENLPEVARLRGEVAAARTRLNRDLAG